MQNNNTSKSLGWFTRNTMHSPSNRAAFWAGAAKQAADYCAPFAQYAWAKDKCIEIAYHADRAHVAGANGFPATAYASARKAVALAQALGREYALRMGKALGYCFTLAGPSAQADILSGIARAIYAADEIAFTPRQFYKLAAWRLAYEICTYYGHGERAVEESDRFAKSFISF